MGLTPRIDRLEKNYVINGGFDIWQRGYTFSGTDLIYTADRWFSFVQAGGSNPQTSRQAISDIPGLQYALRRQRQSGSSSTNAQELVYASETRDAIPLQGKTVTVSFWARKGANFSATSDLLTLSFHTGTGTDQGIVAGWTNQAIVGNTFTLTSVWQRFDCQITIPSNATQFRLEYFYNPTGTAGAADYFEIAGVMLAEGQSTEFVRAGKHIEGELSLCQRYYEILITVNQDDNAFARDLYVGQAYSAVNAYIVTNFRVEKRAFPTLIVSAANHFILITAAGGSVATTGLVASTNQNGKRTLVITATVAAGLAAGNATAIQGANASAHLAVDAEL